MRKTFLKVSLFSLLTVGMAASFTACKDYDDDINNTNNRVDELNKTLTDKLAQEAAALRSEIASAKDEAAKAAAAAESSAKAAAEAAKNAQAAADEAEKNAQQGIADAAAANALAQQALAAAAEAKAEAAEKLLAAVEALEKKIAENSGSIADNAKAIKENAEAIAALQGRLDALDIPKIEDITKAVMEEVTKALGTLKDEITAEYMNEITEVNKQLEQLWMQMGALQAFQEDLEELKTILGNDIENLNNLIIENATKIEQAQAQINELTTQLAEIVTRLETAEGKIGVLEGNIDKIDEKVDSLGGVIKGILDNDGTIAGINGNISLIKDRQDSIVAALGAQGSLITGLSGDIKANAEAIEDIQTQLGLLANTIVDVQANLVLILSETLRSMVFVPELYVDGIEGTRYTFANSNVYKKTVLAANQSGNFWGGNPEDGSTNSGYLQGTWTLTKGTLNEFDYAKDANDRLIYFKKESDSKMTYDLNPSSASITGVDFGFKQLDVELISRADDKKAVVNFVKAEKNAQNQLEVTYNIENPDRLWFTDKYNEKAVVAALQANLPEMNDGDPAQVITSDFAAIVPSVLEFQSLACTSPKFRTWIGYNCQKDLYKSAYSALSNASSQWTSTEGKQTSLIPVRYNDAEGWNIYDNIVVHYTVSDFDNNQSYTHRTMTLAEAKDMYGLELKWEAVPFLNSVSATEDWHFGAITEEGVYYPQWYNEQTGVSSPSYSASENDAITTVGRAPLYALTLVDAEGQIVTYGFIQFFNTDEVEEIVAEPTILGEPKTVPYLCYDDPVIQNMTKWQDLNGLFRKYGISRPQFVSSYRPETVWAENENINVPYMIDADGNMVKVSELEYDNFGTMVKRNADDFGYISYNEDANSSASSGVFMFMADTEQLDSIRTNFPDGLTLYVNMEKRASLPGKPSNLFIGLTIKVAENAEVEYVGQISNLWNSNLTMTTLNTSVPGNNHVVTDFSRDLNTVWDKNRVGLKATNYPQLYPFSGDNAISYQYGFRFAANQIKVGPYTLGLLKDAKGNVVSHYQLYCIGKDLGTASQQVYVANGAAATNVQQYVVASFSKENGKDKMFTPYGFYDIEYNNSDIAKKVLNVFASTETDLSKMLYANVEIVATYGDCEIPLNSGSFMTRFLRPLNVIAGNNRGFVDGTLVGSKNELAINTIFSVTDWRFTSSERIYVYNNGAVGTEKPAGESTTIYLPEYYGISNVTVDLNAAKVLTNLGKGTNFVPLSSVTDKLILNVVQKAADGTFTKLGNVYSNNFTYPTDKTWTALNNIYITYFNDGFNVIDAFDLKVPVTLTYAWGTVTEYVVVKVTKSNNATDPE